MPKLTEPSKKKKNLETARSKGRRRSHLVWKEKEKKKMKKCKHRT